jgi:hypothetical protein
LMYIIIFFSMFAIAILVIFYVLESVVVNSKRYYFLEKQEAVAITKYLAIRKLQSVPPSLERFIILNAI